MLGAKVTASWVISTEPSSFLLVKYRHVLQWTASPLVWTDIIEDQKIPESWKLLRQLSHGSKYWVRAQATFLFWLYNFFGHVINYDRGFVTQLYPLIKWMFLLSYWLFNKPQIPGRNVGFIWNSSSQKKYLLSVAHRKPLHKCSSRRLAEQGIALLWEKFNCVAVAEYLIL